ncbi:hypothetical protein VPH35_100887 [Triticum aestivum]
MERKQEQEKSFGDEAAMAMEASSSVLRSLLHRIAQRCTGYLGLAAPLPSDYSQSLSAGCDHLKPSDAADARGCSAGGGVHGRPGAVEIDGVSEQPQNRSRSRYTWWDQILVHQHVLGDLCVVSYWIDTLVLKN